MEDQNNPNPSDTTQPTPPAPDPSDNPPAPSPTPGVDPQILQAYATQLQAEAQERARLQRELDAERAKANAPKPVTPEQEKEFFDRPVTTTRELIREEIAAAVRPLNQFTIQQQRMSFIEQCKAEMRKNTAQFPYIDQIERQFDQIVNSIPNLDVNAVASAYNLALGQYISTGGRLTVDTPAPPASTPNRGNAPVPPVPPHVRPTPPAPAPAGVKQLRPLSEAEKKIARFNNMTDQEYLFWTGEVGNHEVANLTDEQIKERMK